MSAEGVKTLLEQVESLVQMCRIELRLQHLHLDFQRLNVRNFG